MSASSAPPPDPEATVLPRQIPLHQHLTGNGNLQVGGDINISVPQHRSQQAFYIAKVIQYLADNIEPLAPSNRTLTPFEIVDKITFNGVQRYRRLIEESSTDIHAVEGAYDSLAASSYPRTRTIIQRHLRSKYNSLRAEHHVASSDEILQMILKELKALARNADGLPAEVVDPCCDIIVAHAFVECTILETPPHVGRP